MIIIKKKKKFFFIFIVFLILIPFLVIFNLSNLYLKKKENKSVYQDNIKSDYKKKQTLKKKENKKISKKSLFVADWMIGSIAEKDYLSYCPIIYFGKIENIDLFTNEVRLNSNCDSLFLNIKIDEIYSESDWQVKIDEIIKIIKENNLQGIVLDLEIGGLGNEELVKSITMMVKIAAERIRQNNYSLAIALYGDTFYRKRPYDVKAISLLVDEVMIMAYDFSKSYGKPGPNFPFFRGEKFSYDFQTMISDFLNVVPREKLTIIFGMFGYDWQVDEKKRPISSAKALTLKQIKKKFFEKQNEVGGDNKQQFIQVNCSLANCLAQRDEEAKEIEINYTLSRDQPDENGIYLIDYHIVWFEDEESVAIKKQYLREKGITSISFWAAGYF